MKKTKYIPGVKWLDLTECKNESSLYYKKYLQKVPFRLGTNDKRFDVAEELIDKDLIRKFRNRSKKLKRKILRTMGYDKKEISGKIKIIDSKPIGFSYIPEGGKIVGV